MNNAIKQAILATALILAVPVVASAQCGGWNGSDLFEAVMVETPATGGDSSAVVVIQNPTNIPATFTVTFSQYPATAQPACPTLNRYSSTGPTTQSCGVMTLPAFGADTFTLPFSGTGNPASVSVFYIDGGSGVPPVIELRRQDAQGNVSSTEPMWRRGCR